MTAFTIEPDEAGNWPTLREASDRYMLAALERSGNNKPLAAKQLGIGLKTLYNHLNAIALRSERYEREHDRQLEHAGA